MIILNEVAEKIQAILNHSDNPVGYNFIVATTGFHLDQISDKQSGGNFIPVFIGSLGGRFNAVPTLLEEEVNIPITFYFPVRFKDDFFALQKYLAEKFVGGYMSYGTNTGYCVSNITPAQYGEIADLDLKEYKTWVENVYQREIEIKEPYMSMNITLYLSSMASDYLYGNSATFTLAYSHNNTTLTDTPTFASGSMQSNSEPAAQQLLGATIPESEGLAVNTAMGTSFAIYYKSNTFYQTLLEKWFGGTLQNLALTLTLTLDTKTYTRTVYIQSVNMPISKGQPITLTITFSKKVSI